MPTSRFPQPPATPLTLSVVMAVYNEAETVATAIERVLAVDIPDVDVELVVVESNSSDGTRRSCHATRPMDASAWSSRTPRGEKARLCVRGSGTRPAASS